MGLELDSAPSPVRLTLLLPTIPKEEDEEEEEAARPDEHRMDKRRNARNGLQHPREGRAWDENV